MKIRKDKRPTKGVMYFRGISPTVKLQFKSICVKRGDSMQEVIESLMLLYVKNPEEIKIRKKKGTSFHDPFRVVEGS